MAENRSAPAVDPLEQLNAEGHLPFDLFVTFKVNQLSMAFERQWTRYMREQVGLSLAEWRILATLSGAEPRTFTSVVQAMGMNKSLCSRCVGSLQAAGLIEAAATPGDKRSILLALTPAGRRLVGRLRPAVLRRQRMLLESLTRPERLAFYAAVDKLHQAAAHWDEHRRS